MIERRRGADRPRTVHEGCEARHGFSFGAHYDPANTFFGGLVASNEERIAPGAGYPTHRHHEADLVTWVLSGELRHSDSLGNAHVLRPGAVQVLSAGTGAEHAEHCAGSLPVRFLQYWLVPDLLTAPALHGRDLTAALAAGEPVLVASGECSPDTVPLRRADAALWAAHLPSGAVWTPPEGRFVHVHTAAGSLSTPAGELGEGDELRLTAEPAPELTAGAAGTQVLVWVMDSDLRPDPDPARSDPGRRQPG